MLNESAPLQPEKRDALQTIALIKELNALLDRGDLDNPRYRELEKMDEDEMESLNWSNFILNYDLPRIRNAGQGFDLHVLPNGEGLKQDDENQFELIDNSEVHKILDEKEKSLKDELVKVQEARDSISK